MKFLAFRWSKKGPPPFPAEALLGSETGLEGEAKGRLNGAHLSAFPSDDAHTRRAG